MAQGRSKLPTKLLCGRGGASAGRGHWTAGNHKLHCSGVEGGTRAESLQQEPGGARYPHALLPAIRGAQRTSAGGGQWRPSVHTSRCTHWRPAEWAPALSGPLTLLGLLQGGRVCWGWGQDEMGLPGSASTGGRPLACLRSSCFHELAQKVGRLSKVISKVKASCSEFTFLLGTTVTCRP